MQTGLRAALILGLCLHALTAQAQGTGACSDRVAFLRGPWGQMAFNVEVADDPRERARGLMFRTEMPRDDGMLFIFEQPQSVSFWMRNTLIPLDMVFLSADGVVQSIHANAQPLDERPIFGGTDILAVLEINGGQAAELGLTPGSELRHPAFDPSRAAWPCP
ncbi:MAG: DUF192 domain-containing protein [Rhodobacteraceae bacterium]|nr:DUF192 domain-containing protein [Paracoccaceae bacterium]